MKVHFHVNGSKPRAKAAKSAVSEIASRLGIVECGGDEADVVVALGGSIDELIGLKTPDASETPLTRAYNRIIEEKDARINRLEIAHSLQRKEKYAVAVALFVIIAVIAVILIIDFSNGGLGYVRY